MAARTLKTFLIDGGHCQPRHRTKERDAPALGTGGSSWRRCSWLLRFSVFVAAGGRRRVHVPTTSTRKTLQPAPTCALFPCEAWPRDVRNRRDGEPVRVGGDGGPRGPGPLRATAGQALQGENAMHAKGQRVAEVTLRKANQHVRAGAFLEVGADSQPEITITRMLFSRGRKRIANKNAREFARARSAVDRVAEFITAQ